MTTPSPEWLTTREASALMLSTEENVRRMIWSGRLQGEQIGDTTEYRVSARSVQKIMESGAYVPGMSQPGE